MSRPSLREFLYLDTERVRSYLAQLHEGVPESTTRKSGSEAGLQGEAEGAIPLLAKGKVGAQYRYLRSDDETKSLHHHAYTLFEKHLRQSDRLRDIDAEFAEHRWGRDAFRDGEIVCVRGAVRVIDYSALVEMVRGLPTYNSLMEGMAKSLGQSAQNGKTNGHKQGSVLPIKPKEIDIMAQLIERTFGDTVRVKIRPSPNVAQNTFAAVALRAGFQDGPGSVQQSQGLDLGASWVVVGQVNAPRPELSEKVIDDFSPFTTGNPLEDRLEELVFRMDAFRRMTSGVEYPCVSMNLISIYREC